MAIYLHSQGLCSRSRISWYGGVPASVTRCAVYFCDGEGAEAGEGVGGALCAAVTKEEEQEEGGTQVGEPAAALRAVHRRIRRYS